MTSSYITFHPSIMTSTIALLIFPALMSSVASGNKAPVLKLSLVKTEGQVMVEIKENSTSEILVGIVDATDEDEGPEGKVNCHTDSQYISVSLMSSSWHKIELFESLDYELDTTVDVSIVCSDAGTPPLSSTAYFTICVIDVNDNRPIFSRDVYETSIPENEPISDKLNISIEATDSDSGHNAEIVYMLVETNGVSEERFEIDPRKGDIYTLGPLDHEESVEITLIVRAIDLGIPALNTTAAVKITVLDLNDNSPIFLTDQIRVREGLRALTAVGKILATDADSGEKGQIIFRMAKKTNDASTSPPFLVYEDGTVVAVVPLDRERRDSYTIYVEATDMGSPPLTNVSSIDIIVTDINDNAPTVVHPRDMILGPDPSCNDSRCDFLSIDWYCPLDDRTVYQTKAIDRDEGENGRVSYSIKYINDDVDGVDSLFKVDPDTGKISLKRCVRHNDSLTQIVSLAFTDNGQPSLQVFASLNITLDVDFNSFTSPIPTTSRQILVNNDPSSSTDLTGSALLIITSSLYFLSTLPCHSFWFR